MKKIKISIIILSVLILLLIVYSCAKREPAQSPASDTLMEKINDQFSELNINVERDAIGAENTTDWTKVEDFSIKKYKYGEYSEVGIFKLYSGVNAEYIKEILQKRILSLQENAESLDALHIANNGEARSYGNYVYYVLHAEKDRIFKIIEDALR